MVELPSVAVTIEHRAIPSHRLYRRLLAGSPPLVGRIEDDLLLLDMRTVQDQEVPELVTCLTGLAATEVSGQEGWA